MAREALVLDAFFSRRSRPRDDDGAIVPPIPEGSSLVLTTDALEDGVHFREEWLAIEDLAWKLLAVNLSDIAAMGAEPSGYLLSIAWPEAWPAADAASLGAALEAAERAWACPLLGGDTDVRPGPIRLEVTMLGHARRPVQRSTARAGDDLYVTGPLGGAAAVVRRLLAGLPIDETDPSWIDALARFRRPVPRLDAARAVRSSASALIDLSDGLVPDARRLALASGLAAVIDASRVPVHPAVAADCVQALGLEGGEDYELLVAGDGRLAGLPGLVRIGALEEGIAGTLRCDWPESVH
jgi:thiamine-monophosphate kinase